MTHLSVYKNSSDTTGVIASLDAVIDRIRSGANGLDEKTRYCNALALTDKEAYRTYKAKALPAVIFAGTFPKSKRKAQYLSQHSGFVVLDIDDLPPEQIPDLLAEFAQHPYIRLAFISPSGAGIKAVVRVDPVPTDALEHKGAWQACVEFFEDMATEHGFEVDPTGKNVDRLCYLAHDAQAIIHEDVPAIEWDRDAWLKAEKEKIERFEADAKIAYTGEADVKALDFIDPNDLDYNQWLSVITACKQAGLTIEQTDQWSRRGGVRYQAGEVESRWDGLHIVSWGAVVNLAKANGYKRRRNHKPVKLHKQTDIECITEPIEKARDALRQSFEADERFIGFRADTGIGKTHETITLYQIKGIGGFFSTPTTELAKEVEARLETAECDVFRWRGLHAEPDGQFPHEKPCMFPDEYRAYAESGRNAYKMLCEPVCPHFDECKQHGYLSQKAKAKAAQVTVAAHKDLLMNPLFRSTAERLLPKHKEDLIVIDEFDVFEAFIKIEVSQARLEYLRDTWCDHPLGDFAINVLQACAAQNAPYTGIAAILDDMSSTEQESILTALSSYRQKDTVYSRKEAQGIGSDIGQTLEYIRSLPKIEREDWNLLVQLEIFFDAYRHPAGAPIEWKDNTLIFYLPPLPYFTEAKVICMSATLNKAFFEKAFAVRQAKREDVGFIDAADTEWHLEAKVFQLRTNRNPRRTLLTREKNDKGQWHYTGLTDTGQQALDAILQSARDTPERQHALISYKFVTETYAEQIADAGIITGHFGGLVGLDSHFNRDTDDGIVLHILGAPHEPPDVTEHHYNLLYGDQKTAPDFTRHDTTGEYRNSNMQAVYEAGVKSELMQAIGRAGLVKNPSTVVLWTSLELPSVSHRDQTLHFDEVDWMNADGNLDALPATIETREAQEQAEAEAVAIGDVQAVMDSTGQSERTARRKTKSARDQKKADRDAEIIRLHKEGHSQREIERQLKGTPYEASRKVIGKVVQNGHAQEVTYLEDVRNAPPSENVDDIKVKDQPDAHTCERSVAIGELETLDFEALGFEQKTIQLQHEATGEIISVKVFSKPLPHSLQDWIHARKEAITNDITSLYNDGEHPSEIAAFLGVPEPFVNTVIASLDF